jgi:uncharacterized membrane protein YkgB
MPDQRLLADPLSVVGTHVARYGLAIVLLWIGGMKFTAYEAEGIKPMVANSPFMGWAPLTNKYRVVVPDVIRDPRLSPTTEQRRWIS